jgi:putative membrane protein insertion efficiency factor
MLSPSCRFYPSCSTYSVEAIKEHGAFKGSILTVKRLCRCHPLNEGGIDLVPDRKK